MKACNEKETFLKFSKFIVLKCLRLKDKIMRGDDSFSFTMRVKSFDIQCILYQYDYLLNLLIYIKCTMMLWLLSQLRENLLLWLPLYLESKL